MTNKRGAGRSCNFKGRFLSPLCRWVCLSKKIILLDQKNKPTTIIKHCASAEPFYCFFNYDAAAARVVSLFDPTPKYRLSRIADYYFFEKHRGAGLNCGWAGSILHTLYLSANEMMLHITQIYAFVPHISQRRRAFIYNAMCAPSEPERENEIWALLSVAAHLEYTHSYIYI